MQCIIAPPVHGTAIVGTFGANQPIIYTHNGTSGTTDTFTVNDGDPPPNNQIRVNVTITPPTSSIVISPASLSAITAGAPFSQTLTATGGTAPYAWSISGGTIPPGLTLSNSGVISGIATQRGAFNFTVRAQDALGAISDKGYSGTIAVPTLVIAPNSATAAQNQPFSLTIAASGGVSPYSFLHEVVAGALPPGMSLSSTGVLSGTPTTVGTTNFQMRVSDSSTGPGSYFELENFSFNVVTPPLVSISAAPASVSEDGATNAVVTVTRSLNLTSPTVVNITTSGTATSGGDYVGGVTTVTIPAGATTATFTVDPVADTNIEADETATFTVATGTGYTVGAPSAATVNILNDDVPTVSIAVAPVSVAEDGAPNLVYTVSLNQAAAIPVSVNYVVAGSATSGVDFAAVTSPLVIPAGATSGTITINPAADATIEADETVIISLAAGAGYIVGAPNSANGTILNDDVPNLTINDVTINEGNSGTTNAVFSVSLSAPAGPAGVSFDIATANGTATGGSDYVAQSLTGQSIPAGSNSYSFTVQLNGDILNEPSETLFVNVTNVVNAVVVDGQGVGTIVNDDPLPSLSINDVTVTEGNGGTVNAVFTVSLSAASGQTVSVNYATANGTATQPADYTNTTGTLTFNAGITTQTVTVPVIGETAPEPNESFFVNLSGATNATLSDNQGLGSITNDDVPIAINPTTLPNGTVAIAYSQTVTASGGTAPYGFAVTAGTLPTGLTLSAGGLLSGTPTAGGNFSFTIAATDASGAPGPYSGSQAYSVAIAPPTILLAATTLADGTLGQVYSANITAASDGTAPYAYTITAGALPGGLTLNGSTGAITGTASALGNFTFSITATDSSTGTGPYSATQSYAINVIDVAPVAANSSLSLAYNAAATNVPLSLSGGATTSLNIGSAPANGTATVSGTTISYQPNAGYAGADSFTYTATNSGGTSAPATVTITVQDPVVTITAAGSLSATIGAPYSQTFSFAGGGAPWGSYQVTNLPTGLSITGSTTSSVTISGTPTQAGSFSLNVSGTDSSTGNGPFNVDQLFTLNVGGPNLAMTPAAGTLSAPYAAPFSQAFTATGGTGSFSYVLSGGLPQGLGFSGSTLSGTPTTPGSYTITVTATDTGATGTGAPFSIAQNYTIDVPAPTVGVTPASLPTATAGTAYSQGLSGTGGVAPYGFAITAGSLPNGVSLSGSTISGTPVEVGSFPVTIIATDANGQLGSRAYTLTVGAPVLALTPASGTVSVAFNAPVSQTYAASGGVGPYSYAISAGTLPSGVTLDASTGTLSGSTIQVGTFNFSVTATDSGISGVGAPFTVTGAYALTVAPPVITIDQSSLPAATVASAYTSTLTASGGVAPHSFAVTAGGLPAGLSLSPAGVLSGTPTAGGSFTFTVSATDASGAPGPFSGSQAFTLNVAAPVLALPSTTLAGGQRGTAYTAVLNPASGGTAPYSYAVTGGALPSGVSLSSAGTFSGTPSAFGSFTFTVTATDSSTGTGPYSANQTYTLSVVDQPPVATSSTLTVGYNAPATTIVLNLSGGAPTALAITSAPANGTATVSGTSISYQPNTGFSGTDSFSYTATNSGGTSAPATVTITVDAPTFTVAAVGPLDATVGQDYGQVFTFAGGTEPFGSYQVTGLPAGLAITDPTANSIALAGIPREVGTFTLSVSATDSSTGNGPFIANRSFTLTVAAPTLLLQPASSSFVSNYAAPFSQTIAARGGIGPYSYSLGGSLPAGVTLNPATGTISGTPTVSGNFAFTITAIDGGATGAGAPFTVTENYTLIIAAPTIVVNPAALPSGTAGQAYTATLSASGAVGPYSFSLTGGTLPAGVSLSPTGQLSGTPTASGSFPITVGVRDANGQTGSVGLTLNVGIPTLTIAPATLPGAFQGIAYSQALTVSGGIAPYSFTVSSGALPAGLTLNTASGLISGTPSGFGQASFAITVTDSTGGTPATLTINYTLQVTARPDPANDPEVRGLVRAQVDATRRFADAQVDNFMARMEGMHAESGDNGGTGDGAGIAFNNSVRISTPDYCRDAITMMTNAACANRRTGLVSLNNWKAEGQSKADSDAGAANAGSGSGTGGPVTIWAGGAIRFGERDANSGRVRQDFESEGITIGADYRFSPSFAAGLGIGLGRDTVDVGDNGSQSRGEAKTIALYGSVAPAKGWFIDGLLGYQTLDFDLRRYVTSTGGLVSSNRDGDQWFATLSAGTDIETGNWHLTPYARFDMTRATLKGYAENSGSVFDLTFLDQNVNFTSLGLGTRIKYSHKTGWGYLLPQLRAEYQWNVERSADARVTYNDLVANPFSVIPLSGIGREELTLGAKLEAMLGSDLGLALEYLGRFSKGNGSDGTVQVGMKYEF
jgi:large repetitive protein